MDNRLIRSKLYEITGIIGTKGEANNTTKYDLLYYYLDNALNELEGIMYDDNEINSDNEDLLPDDYTEVD